MRKLDAYAAAKGMDDADFGELIDALLADNARLLAACEDCVIAFADVDGDRTVIAAARAAIAKARGGRVMAGNKRKKHIRASECRPLRKLRGG